VGIPQGQTPLNGQFSIGANTATGFVRVQVDTGVESSSFQGLSLRFNDGTQLTGITQANLCLIKQLLEVLR
jgi:hypothetical protein